MSASKPGASLPFLLPAPHARAATLVAAANASNVLNPRLANRTTPCGSTACGLRGPTPASELHTT
jgi:hypothetical protein